MPTKQHSDMNEPQNTLCEVYNLTEAQANSVTAFFKGYYETKQDNSQHSDTTSVEIRSELKPLIGLAMFGPKYHDYIETIPTNPAAKYPSQRAIEELNYVLDYKLMPLITQYGTQQRLDELDHLPNCNIESKFLGSTNVILVKDVIKRRKELTSKQEKK